jgi:hypothetical protein
MHPYTKYGGQVKERVNWQELHMVYLDGTPPYDNAFSFYRIPVEWKRKLRLARFPHLTRGAKKLNVIFLAC